jgi:GTP pyrophosphokinase
MSSYGAFLERYRQGAERRQRELIDARTALERVTRSLDVAATLQSRIKRESSTWRKMCRCGLDFDEVHDLLGLRVLLDRTDQCYRVLDALQGAWPGQWERVKDYIVAPKPNGYQSLHLCVVPHDNPRFEVQIRTHEMHRRSVSGRAAHGRYKLQVTTPPGPGAPRAIEDAAA